MITPRCGGGFGTDEEWGEAFRAIIVPLEGLEEINIIEFAQNRLSGPKVPKQIFFYPELPKTGSGKVLKKIYENKSEGFVNRYGNKWGKTIKENY